MVIVPTSMTDRPVHFFVHVPKCAGRSIELHLEKYLGERFLYLRRKRGLKRHLSSEIYRLPQRFDPAGTDAVSGHALGRSMASHFKGREIRESVLLRDPLSMLVSFYNFRMSRFTVEGWPHVSFERFYQSRHVNPMSTFLLVNYLELSWTRLARMPRAEKFERLSERLADFWFVGDYRQCDSLIGRISVEFGIPDQAPRANVLEKKLLTVDTVSAAMRDRILDECALDQAIYDAWAGRGYDRMDDRPPAPVLRDRPGLIVAHEAKRQIENARITAMRKRLGRLPRPEEEA
ncbi:hypothetical protein [Minwuia sp.]|uniref:hypothetical protein n=1 Tax=Minwuia sp. TaxID=2493630 RepID=UPI003A94AAAB